MRIIPYTYTEMDLGYPVGNYMTGYMQFVAKCAPILKSLIDGAEYSGLNLWCRGSSGAIIAALFVAKLKELGYPHDIRVAHVKKDGERSHGSSSYIHYAKNVIVDDFICSGETINAIHADMYGMNVDALIVGAYNRETWSLNFVPDVLVTEPNKSHIYWKMGLYELHHD